MPGVRNTTLNLLNRVDGWKGDGGFIYEDGTMHTATLTYKFTLVKKVGGEKKNHAVVGTLTVDSIVDGVAQPQGNGLYMALWDKERDQYKIIIRDPNRDAMVFTHLGSTTEKLHVVGETINSLGGANLSRA